MSALPLSPTPERHDSTGNGTRIVLRDKCHDVSESALKSAGSTNGDSPGECLADRGVRWASWGWFKLPDSVQVGPRIWVPRVSKRTVAAMVSQCHTVATSNKHWAGILGQYRAGHCWVDCFTPT